MKTLTVSLLLLTAVFLACSTNPVVPPVFTLTQGVWTGEFFEDTVPLTFTVVGDTVRGFQATLTYDFGGHIQDSTYVWLLDDFQPAGDSFDVSDEVAGAGYDFSIQIDGTFVPPDRVSGRCISVGIFQGSMESDTVSVDTTWEASPV